MKTKDRIVLRSIELFNRDGVVPVTTNHIAKELGISPGNLYFHFANKEEIIRQIFKMMCAEVYSLWRTKKSQRLSHPLEMIEKTLDVCWRYRFIFRESYYLRHKDAAMGKLWKTHIQKCLKLMELMYKRWLKAGWMTPIKSKDEITFLVTMILSTASTFMQFYESAHRQPTRQPVTEGTRYIARLLVHNTQGEMHEEFQRLILKIS
jgi:AcrR family transcriptional regulator